MRASSRRWRRRPRSPDCCGSRPRGRPSAAAQPSSASSRVTASRIRSGRSPARGSRRSCRRSPQPLPPSSVCERSVRLTARVPATSANLGPGFDALAIALDLCNEVTIETAPAANVTWEGEADASLPRDGSDLVNAAFRSVFDDAGIEPPTVALHGVNRIPVERGLGSSAAAVVAGVALAFAALGRELEPDAMAPFTDGFEDHHDNVAAALRGALTIAYTVGDGWRAARLEAHPDLRPVALVPETRLSTVLAREALPSAVPLMDAAFDAGRAALVVHALTVAPSLLPVALEDRLHQEVRLELLPEAREVFEKVRSDGVPVCVSGAGPSLMAFETPERSVPDPGGSWRSLRLAVRSAGVEVWNA